MSKTDSERLALFVIYLFLAIMIGFFSWRLGTDQPNCPYEDSCYPEYTDGQWIIIEGER